MCTAMVHCAMVWRICAALVHMHWSVVHVLQFHTHAPNTMTTVQAELKTLRARLDDLDEFASNKVILSFCLLSYFLPKACHVHIMMCLAFMRFSFCW